MGKILKPRGLRGELKVFLFNELNSSLKSGLEIWFKGSFNFSHIIENVKIAEKKSIIKFVDCNSRDDVSSLQGLIIYLSREDFNTIL